LAQRRGSAARPAALQLARVRRWTPTVSFPHSRRLWAVSVALATSRGRARLQFWLDQRIDTELGGTAGRGDNGPTTQSLRRVKARGTPRAVKGAREGTGTTLLFTLTLRGGGGTAAFLRALSSGRSRFSGTQVRPCQDDSRGRGDVSCPQNAAKSFAVGGTVVHTRGKHQIDCSETRTCTTMKSAVHAEHDLWIKLACETL